MTIKKLACSLLVFLPVLLRAQDAPAGQPRLDSVVFDTVKVVYAFEDDDRRFVPDSSLAGLHLYNHARQRDNELAWLGNFGSPTTPLVWQPVMRKGFFTGLEQFESYRLKQEDLRFYQSKYPFTDLYYSQAGQANSLVHAKFGHIFPSRFGIAIDYRFLNQKGNFAHQRARHQNMGFSFRWETANHRYQFYTGYLYNFVKHQDNGGIQADSLMDGVVSFPETLPIETANAQTEQRFHEIYFHQYFLLKSGKDSAQTGSGGRFAHLISWKSSRYKFFDAQSESVPGYYGNFLTNPRGLRTGLLVGTLHNIFRYEQRIGKGAVAPWLLSAGVEHFWHRIRQEPVSDNLSQLFAVGRVRTNPALRKLFNADVYGHFGLLGAVGDYAVDANMTFDFGKWGVLEGRFFNQFYTPGLAQRQLYVSQELVWDNESFTKVKEFTISAGLAIPRLGFKAMVHSHAIGGFVYADSNRVVRQDDGTVALLQVQVKEDFKLWKFHFENTVTWQSGGSERIRFPQLYFKHGLNFETRLFKKAMLFRVGVDMRYATSFQGYGYFPLTGQFYLQNEKSLDFFPLLDAHIAFKVNRFRVFLLGENISQDIFQKGYFQVLHYPMGVRSIRFGVSWYLSD